MSKAIGKRITAKQRAARRKNIAIARSYKKKGSSNMLDDYIKARKKRPLKKKDWKPKESIVRRMVKNAIRKKRSHMPKKSIISNSLRNAVRK